ncbi:MAG TPA: recombinase family protein [Nitrospira sp.]|nr:recombinase family protein [Nitrospira sp.]
MKNNSRSRNEWEPQQGSKAVIYARVSSAAQVKKGDGLGSQETRCRQLAQNKGYEVVRVFRDEGASGGMVDRPGMLEMLQFLKSQKQDQYVVLIDDISRLARGLEAHIQLRTLISGIGAKLASPSIEFGEDSDSMLVENLLASVSQHQRQKNAEQTKNRMKARVMNGYWCFCPPVGMKFTHVPGHVGKVLVPDEPAASVVREALEGYASGRFETQNEVRLYLEKSPHYPKSKAGTVYFQEVANLLGKVLYAGLMNVPEWGLYLHPAKHEPLISFETYQAIQDRLQGTAKAPARKDLHDDFPLRGFITCSACSMPMTACWSAGRHSKYPYYLCRTKGCPDYKKSIRKEILERDFEILLGQLRPTPNLFHMASDMFKELWEDRRRLSGNETQAMKTQLLVLDERTEKLLNRLIETDNRTAIQKYENEVTRLEEEKLLIREKIQKCGRPLEPFEDCFRTAMTFLANPCHYWSSDRLEDKRMVLRLVFAKRLAYHRQEGFRTAKNEELSLPFRYLKNLGPSQYEMVRPVGIEPTTLSLEGPPEANDINKDSV